MALSTYELLVVPSPFVKVVAAQVTTTEKPVKEASVRVSVVLGAQLGVLSLSALYAPHSIPR